MTFSVMSRSASAPSLQAALHQAPEREASWITSPPMLPIPHAHSSSSAQAARGSLQMGLLSGFPLSPRMGSACGAASAPSCHASCSDPSPRFSLRHSVPGSQFFGASAPESRPGGAMGIGMRRVFSDNTLRGTTMGESTPRLCRVTSSHDLHGSAGAGWDASSKDASSAQGEGDAPLLLPSTLLNASLQGFASNGAPFGASLAQGKSTSAEHQGPSEADGEASPSSSSDGRRSVNSINSMNSLKSITGMSNANIRRPGSVPLAGSAPTRKLLQGIGEGDGEEEEEEAVEGGMEDAVIVGITESVREGPVLWLEDWRKSSSLRPLAPRDELTYSDTSPEGFCDTSFKGGKGLPKAPPQEENTDTDSTDTTEEYYVRALQDDPDNGLILRNFSRFLVQTKGDYITAERCLEKAVAACPRDADVLVQYAKLLWDFRHDAEGATTFFERAVQAAPDDCYVLAAYASFLWSVDATSNAAAAAEAVASKPSRPATLLTPAT